MANRVWEDGQPVWGEESTGGWVAGTVVHIGGSWTVEWHHAHRFIGPAGYADPRAELEEYPFTYRYNRLVERLPGEADMFSGTPSFMEQLVVLHQLAVPKHKRYKVGANLIQVLLRYFQPLPGLQMAEMHYRTYVEPCTCTPVHTRAAFYEHRSFLPYYRHYLVRRWRIIIACNGAHALSDIDVDKDMEMTHCYYNSAHRRMLYKITRQLRDPRVNDEYIGLEADAATMASEDLTDDERWLK